MGDIILGGGMISLASVALLTARYAFTGITRQWQAIHDTLQGDIRNLQAAHDRMIVRLEAAEQAERECHKRNELLALELMELRMRVNGGQTP